jgi:hypothetical protein
MADRRQQLARQLFGLSDGGEVQTQMASRIAEAILQDLIKHATKAWNDDGPGVLVIRSVCDDARWSPAAMLQENLSKAEAIGDAGMAQAFASTLRAIEALNIEEQAPIAIADHRGWRLMLIPTHEPARSVVELLEQCKA